MEKPFVVTEGMRPEESFVVPLNDAHEKRVYDTRYLFLLTFSTTPSSKGETNHPSQKINATKSFLCQVIKFNLPESLLLNLSLTMVRFTLIAVSSLLATVQAAQNLRAPELTKNGRKLSYQYITNYEPRSQVTDHNALDLDQKVIEEQIALQNENSFARARDVYEQGGHSKSYAKLKITSGNKPNVSDGTLFTGTDMSGRPVTGKVYESSTSPSDELRLQYSTSDIQSSYVGCQVGALPPTGRGNTDGCFAANGTVTTGTTQLTYEYEPLQDNLNGRTIKGFSTAVRPRMLECPKW